MADDDTERVRRQYQRPTVGVLGTLTELTQGPGGLAGVDALNLSEVGGGDLVGGLLG